MTTTRTMTMTMTSGTMTKNGTKHQPLIIENGKDMRDPNFDEHDESKDKESANAISSIK